MSLEAAFAGLVLGIFNLPVIFLLCRLPFVASLKEALSEKSPVGGASDTTSYSRITGMVGAVIVTSFFWAIGNIAIYKAFTQIDDIRKIISAVAPLFMVGSALFLPYAFNQIKSAFGAAGAGAVAAAAAVGTAPPAAPTVNGVVKSGPSLNLMVVNLSTAIDDATFSVAVAAIGVQVNRDFQPAWGSNATLSASRVALNGAQANINGAVDAIIYVGDSSNDPTTGVAGAFGYHSTNYGELPYAFVYLDVCAQYGEAWSCTLSHEILELLADPTTVLTATGPAPAGAGAGPDQTVRYDLEVCDPTQGDHYKINNVTVSNFVTKAYFGMATAAPATNFLDLTLAPFDVRPGGYVQYEDSAGTHQINGAKVDAHRRAARAILAGYRRNARRETERQRLA
jgi:hypothetical protein